MLGLLRRLVGSSPTGGGGTSSAICRKLRRDAGVTAPSADPFPVGIGFSACTPAAQGRRAIFPLIARSVSSR